MSNVITQWRQAVMAQLDEKLQDGEFDVVAGVRDGKPSRDRKLACVFAPPMKTNPGNVSFTRPVLIVRAWVPQPKTPKATSPQDPEPVEQLMIDLAVCLQAVQSLQIGIWGLYVVDATFETDYDDWGVQATLEGWTGNPAVLPLAPI